MLFFTVISYLATILHIAFFTLGLAAALYYVAEMVEEYTMAAAKVIRTLILLVMGLNIGFLVFEDLPTSLSIVGIVSQIVHLALMTNFPAFELFSPSFISAIVLTVIHHYVTFNYFADSYHPFQEVLAYFTLCLWTVPFAFFVSLSANDQVLPTLSSSTPSGSVFDPTTGGNDVVSHYFAKGKGQKKYGLLSFFNWMRDSVFPSQQKRFS